MDICIHIPEFLLPFLDPIAWYSGAIGTAVAFLVVVVIPKVVRKLTRRAADGVPQCPVCGGPLPSHYVLCPRRLIPRR